jgi:hypothetical protein
MSLFAGAAQKTMSCSCTAPWRLTFYAPTIMWNLGEPIIYYCRLWVQPLQLDQPRCFVLVS